MFTSWDQVEGWIRDNNFKRWICYREKPEGENKGNFKIVDSAQFTVSDLDDKLSMTEKYLRMSGGRAWCVATGNTAGETLCEIRLSDETQPAAGIGNQMPIQDIGAIEERVRKQVLAEIRIQDLDKREKAIEEREKALEQEKNTALGALVHYFAPIGQMLLQKKMPMVAGLDAEAPVTAEPIQPIQTPEQPEENESPFTDEEEQEIFELLSEFKALEPDCYLKLIRSVVEMKKTGNPMYETAKGFLLK